MRVAIGMSLTGRARTALLAAGVLAAAAPAAASGAGGGVFGEYVTLAQRERSPAPLVPVSLPAALGSGEQVELEFSAGSGGRYLMRFTRAGIFPRPGAPLLVLEDLGAISLAKGRARLGSAYSASPTRVRGHPALTLHERFGAAQAVMWREDGRVYEMATGAPRAISLSQVRATASGLQHLLGAYTAQFVSADDGLQEAEALITDRALNVNLMWDSPCSQPGVELAPDRGGTAQAGWVTLAGGAFTRSPLTVGTGAGAWTVALSGRASAAGGQVTFQASSSAGAERCAIGPLTLTLVRLPRLVKAT